VLFPDRQQHMRGGAIEMPESEYCHPSMHLFLIEQVGFSAVVAGLL